MQKESFNIYTNIAKHVLIRLHVAKVFLNLCIIIKGFEIRQILNKISFTGLINNGKEINIPKDFLSDNIH